MATIALLALTATTALAGGINLSWDDCGPSGIFVKTFACDTNSGTDVLYVSAVPPVAMSLNGHESTITISTFTPTFPLWWQRQFGGCHSGNPTGNTNFIAEFNCVDPWADQASAGVVFDYPSVYGPAVARIRTISAMVSGGTPVNNADELYLIKVGLNHTKSTGAGACAGCTQAVCIVLQSVALNGPGGTPHYVLSNALDRQFVAWQSSGPLVGCPAAVPTRNQTWGSIKTMYR